MEFVPIDAPGNPPHPRYRVGSVPYAFEMARYPVTNAEYAAFLNAVARAGDPYSLYCECLGNGLFGGIDRAKRAGKFRYVPKPGWERRPVVYVSWYDMARLANWYHYGCPDGGRSVLGTTEGTAGEGAYDTRRFPSYGDDAPVPYRSLPARRNAGARYWIPNEDEWAKAGHYDAARRGRNKYWEYPVRTDAPPNNAPSPGDKRSANYFRDVFAVGKPYFLSEVGSYPRAASAFGTFDQGGNVWEWLENWRGTRGNPTKRLLGALHRWKTGTAVRGLKGGSAIYSEIGLRLSNTDPGEPVQRKFVWGGRLARCVHPE